MVLTATIATKFQYWEPPSDPTIPALLTRETDAPDAAEQTIWCNPQEHVVHDLRTMPEEERGLDKCGFTFVKTNAVAHLKDDDWKNETIVREEYLPRLAELVKKFTGNDRVVMSLSYLVRRADLKAATGKKAPTAQNVHIDLGDGFEGWEMVLFWDLHAQGRQAEFDELRKGRVRMIQVWQPLKHAVKDAPLALVDWRSLDFEKDCYKTKVLRGEKRAMSTYSVRYSPNHKWWSIYQQQPNELLLFKGFDSQDDGVARFIPHSSFKDPAFWGKKGVKPRESCDTRFWVFG